MRVGLATSGKWPLLAPDDHELLRELAAMGIEPVPLVWSDRAAAWESVDLVVIRSCWDYHLRVAEFLGWLEMLGRFNVPVANPPSVIRWNAHKGYLLELQDRGILIPATQLVPRGGCPPALTGGRVIIKPAISASANETHLFGTAEAASSDLARLAAAGDVIVQEFVEEVVSDGEWSLIFFGRQLSHAVKKTPRQGDFRVQQELGGAADPLPPPARLVDVARRALDLVDEPLLYARVDLVDRKAGVTLMELELIEPSLFLSTSEGASARFAEAIREYASG